MAEDIQGVQVVKGGASIDRAAAYDYIANSEWPTMTIIKQGLFDIAVPAEDFPSGITIYEHNLGYYSPFYAYENSYYQTGGVTYIDRYKVSMVNNYGIFNYRNRLSTGPIHNSSGLVQRIKVYYILFDHNLEVPFSPKRATSIAPTSAISSDYGVKTLKGDTGGRDMESPRLEDYTVNTQGQSLTVHMNGAQRIEAASDYKLDVVHNLGYLPSFHLFKEDITFMQEAITIENQFVIADNIRLTARGVQSVLLGQYYWLITKDPFVLELP